MTTISWCFQPLIHLYNVYFDYMLWLYCLLLYIFFFRIVKWQKVWTDPPPFCFPLDGVFFWSGCLMSVYSAISFSLFLCYLGIWCVLFASTFGYMFVLLSLWVSLGPHSPVLALKDTHVSFNFLFSSYFWDIMGVPIWRPVIVFLFLLDMTSPPVCQYGTHGINAVDYRKCLLLSYMWSAPASYTRLFWSIFCGRMQGTKRLGQEHIWVNIYKRSCIGIMRIGTRSCCRSICR